MPPRCKPFPPGVAYNITQDHIHELDPEQVSPYDVCNPFSLPSVGTRRGFLRERRAVILNEIIGDESRAERRGDASLYVGLRNLGQSCYLSSFIQSLFMNVDFRRGVYALYNEGDGDRETPVLFHLARLFAILQSGDVSVADPSALAYAMTLSGQTQEDPTELASLFFDRLEQEIKRKNLPHTILDLFQGQIKHQTVCRECGGLSIRVEAFRELRVQPPSLSPKPSRVKSTKSACMSRETSSTGHESPCLLSPSTGTKRKVVKSATLERLIATSFRKEQLRGSNQYFCSVCNKLVDAVRCGRITHLPPYLYVCVERSTFDSRLGEHVKNLVAIDAPFRLVLETSSDEETETADASETSRLGKKAAYNVSFELVGILEHLGLSAHHGHYRAKLKSLQRVQVSHSPSPKREREPSPAPSSRETDGDGNLNETYKDANIKPPSKRRKVTKEMTQTSTQKNDNSRWLEFDDHRVIPLDEPPGHLTISGMRQVSSESAYWFVYRREDLPLDEDVELPESLVLYLEGLETERNALEKSYDQLRIAVETFVDKTLEKVERFEKRAAECHVEIWHEVERMENDGAIDLSKVLSRLSLIPVEWLRAAVIGTDCVSMAATLSAVSSRLRLLTSPKSLSAKLTIKPLTEGNETEETQTFERDIHTNSLENDTSKSTTPQPEIQHAESHNSPNSAPASLTAASPIYKDTHQITSHETSPTNRDNLVDLNWLCCHTDGSRGRGGIDPIAVTSGLFKLFPRDAILTLFEKADSQDSNHLSILHQSLTHFLTRPANAALCYECADAYWAVVDITGKMQNVLHKLTSTAVQIGDEGLGTNDPEMAQLVVIGLRSKLRLECLIGERDRGRKGPKKFQLKILSGQGRDCGLDRIVVTQVRKDVLLTRSTPTIQFRVNEDLICQHKCLQNTDKHHQIYLIEAMLLNELYALEVERSAQLMKLVDDTRVGIPRFVIGDVPTFETYKQMPFCEECHHETRSQMSRRIKQACRQALPPGQYEMLMNSNFFITADHCSTGRRWHTYFPANGTHAVVCRSWLNDWRARQSGRDSKGMSKGDSHVSVYAGVSVDDAVSAIRDYFTSLSSQLDFYQRQIWWQRSFISNRTESGFFVVQPSQVSEGVPAFIPESSYMAMDGNSASKCQVDRLEVPGFQMFSLSEPLPYKDDGRWATRILPVDRVREDMSSHDLLVVFQLITENGNRRTPNALLPFADPQSNHLLLPVALSSDTQSVLSYVFVTFDIKEG